MLQGSVLSPQNQRFLKATKIYLAELKQQKLEARHERNLNHSWNTRDILYHLNSEALELNQAFLKGEDWQSMLFELADISNMCDILTMELLSEGDKKDGTDK